MFSYEYVSYVRVQHKPATPNTNDVVMICESFQSKLFILKQCYTMDSQQALFSTVVKEIINKYDFSKLLTLFDLAAYLEHVVMKVL